MRVLTTQLRSGITRTRKFEEKALAQFAVNVGTKCGHNCLYCSTGAMLRMHRSFKIAGENPFATGYAIVDPDTPTRVARDATTINKRELVQLCTTVDAWSPEAQDHDLGRKCLDAILSQPGWTVRILTKNAAVVREFDLIERYRNRVLVGLSLTATEERSHVIAVVEPNASPIRERMAALRGAHERGLRTYGMLCPLLPGIADDPVSVDRLVDFVLGCGAEEIFVEPVNPRGPALTMTEQALRAAGYGAAADAIAQVRRKVGWSAYTKRLLGTVQQALWRRGAIQKLRFLLYPSKLSAADDQWILAHPAGVRRLGKS
jgi:DNA repair photolyase